MIPQKRNRFLTTSKDFRLRSSAVNDNKVPSLKRIQKYFIPGIFVVFALLYILYHMRG